MIYYNYFQFHKNVNKTLLLNFIVNLLLLKDYNVI